MRIVLPRISGFGLPLANVFPVYFLRAVFALVVIMLCSTGLAYMNSAQAQSSQSNDHVLRWAELAVETSMSFDYKNFDLVMEDAQKNFTTVGWKSFYKALQRSGTPQSIIDNQQELAVTVTQPFRILSQNEKDERYIWLVEGPVIFEYRDGNKIKPLDLMVWLKIVQSDEEQNINGLGIEQWIANYIN